MTKEIKIESNANNNLIVQVLGTYPDGSKSKEEINLSLSEKEMNRIYSTLTKKTSDNWAKDCQISDIIIDAKNKLGCIEVNAVNILFPQSYLAKKEGK